MVYHLFLGINYPNVQDAQERLNEGTISQKDYDIIKINNAKGKPIWHTSLGGEIGIHGNGPIKPSGDWTAGCIALTNEGIEEIWAISKIGTKVDIYD